MTGRAQRRSFTIRSSFPFITYADRQSLKLVPGVLELQYLARPRYANRLATAASRICIESFPRSGTSYAVALAHVGLELTWDEIASHTHSLANVRRALARGIPTFILSRDALPSCLSLIVWGVRADLADVLRAYHGFYSGLLPMMDRVTVIPFERLIDDPRSVFDALAKSLAMDVSWEKTAADAVARARAEPADPADERATLKRNLPHAAKEERKHAVLQHQFSRDAERWYARCQTLRAQILSTATLPLPARATAAV